MKELVKLNCSRCENTLIRNKDEAAPYMAVNHPFLCNECIENTLKGEN